MIAPDIMSLPNDSTLPSVSIPVIITDRLTMRGHTLADFADMAAMWGDPEVTRFVGGRPQTEEEVWTRLLRYIGYWALLGFGYWIVRETETDRFVGEVGFAERRRALNPSIVGYPEIGWVLAATTHGRGYATEAVRAALAWAESRHRSGEEADAYFDSGRTVCLIDVDNLRSIRVAEKTGYREFARTMYQGQPVILLDRHAG
jgi:RimJ/RimL family protein N-acetyltransferase